MDVASNVGLRTPRSEDVELVGVVKGLARRLVDDVSERDLHLAEKVVARDAVHVEHLKHLEDNSVWPESLDKNAPNFFEWIPRDRNYQMSKTGTHNVKRPYAKNDGQIVWNLRLKISTFCMSNKLGRF